MAGFLPAGSTHHGGHEGGAYKVSHDNPDEYGGRWYLPGKEIEENSPSRRDGIDLKKETYLRKSYCTFLQDLGMRLKVPQVTIATAIIFCHRFFLCQSHAKNEQRTIATVCMFLAGKVEETPRPLKDVIIVSYEIIYKKDPAAAQRIKQKEVYEQQKELILVGERLVLATLGFDLNVLHPYKPLVEAIKKFKVSQKALAQVAWNFVNDGLRTSLCLQFKPDHIAAGAIFLAAKFLKVKLPSDGEKVWWQEFDVTPRQLEEVSNQMLELYEQNRVPLPQPREAEVSAGAAQWPPTKAATTNENHVTSSSNSQGGAVTLELRSLKPTSSWSVAVQSHGDSGGPSRIVQCQNNECGRTEAQGTSSRKREGEIDDNHYHEKRQPLPHPGKTGEHQNESRSVLEGHDAEDQEGSVKRIETRDVGEVKDKHLSRTLDKDSMPAHSPQDAIKKIDKDKVKAALEKRRKSRGNMVWKTDFMDEDDLIERELEQGIEFVAESENNEQERKQISAL